MDTMTLPSIAQWKVLNFLNAKRLSADNTRNCLRVLGATEATDDDIINLIDQELVVAVYDDGTMFQPNEDKYSLRWTTLRILPAGAQWVRENLHNRVLAEVRDRRGGGVNLQLMRHIAAATGTGPVVFAKLVGLHLIRVRDGAGETLDADRTAKPFDPADQRQVALTRAGTQLINPN